MDKLKLHTPDFAEANAAKLAELFPNCVTESRAEDGLIKPAIDFDLLRQELSGDLVEGAQERYRLDWPGKRESLALANAPITKTLRPCKEESVDFETTRNLYIEGDNLDALKLLQETYLNQVKMIYIDPPYNTGNDFIYDDNFSMSREDYEEEAGERDEEGNAMFDEEKWKQNSAANGRFHSEWLSMMYPRLRLARNLLTDDGVLYISIDDGELANLRRVVDEVFGPQNVIAIFTWVKKKKGSHLSPRARSMTEYVICVARSLENVELVGEKAYSDKWQPLAKRTNSRKILKFPAAFLETTLDDGIYEAGDYGVGSSGISFLDDLEVKGGKVVGSCSIEGPFVWTQKKLTSEIALGSRVALSKKFGLNSLRHDQANKVKRPSTLIDKASGVGTNEDAYQEAIELFGEEGIMSYPKPSSLLAYLVRTVTWDDVGAIVLDFFSGSASTADAVMQLNAKDGGDRRYIMVQLPEPCDEESQAYKAGYKSIADIGKERIRRAGKRVRESLAEDISQQQSKLQRLKNSAEEAMRKPGSQEIREEREKQATTEIHELEASIADAQGRLERLDLGFRVLQIDSSNMAEVYYQPDQITQDALDLQVDNVKEGREPEDLLFQVLLDWGVDLGLPITEEEIEGKRVFFVADNALAACFDTGLTEDFCKTLAKREPLRAVFRDAGYASDSTKINIEQIFKALSPHTELKTL